MDTFNTITAALNDMNIVSSDRPIGGNIKLLIKVIRRKSQQFYVSRRQIPHAKDSILLQDVLCLISFLKIVLKNSRFFSFLVGVLLYGGILGYLDFFLQ